MQIQKIIFREILDSRGVPTVASDLYVDGQKFTAMVPSGKSKGEHEAIELRDEDKNRYGGKGLIQSIKKIQPIINAAISHKNIDDDIDQVLIDLDGTENKKNLGANFMLATSIAFERAKIFFNRHSFKPKRWPKLMVNIINGGQHASNNLAFQEFMIVPINEAPLKEHVRMVCEIFHALKDILTKKHISTSVGDEGGFAPPFDSHKVAIDNIMIACENAGYKMQQDIMLAFDFAATSYYKEEYYVFEGLKLNTYEYIDFLKDMAKKYPIISYEDPLHENDFEGFAELTKAADLQMVGDDLFVTNKKYLKKGIEAKAANAILIKPNQIGTLKETRETIELARKHNYKIVTSHRSGETEDSFIADFALSVESDFVKFGSVSRSERTAKYNRLMEIENES